MAQILPGATNTALPSVRSLIMQQREAARGEGGARQRE
jgi:hypothetical protein